MAEAVVALVVQRIADLLTRESTFLRDVKEDVESMRAELRGIQSFLKDADRKQYQNERVRNWVADFRRIAYDAEDVIESYILKIATRRVEGACGINKKVSSIFTKVPRLHVIKSQIESIQNRIKAISTRKDTFDIKLDAESAVPGSASEMQQRLRRSYPHNEDDVISFHAITRDIKAQLMIEAEGRQVVSIVGMGGLGKTTLAKKIYNDINVKQHFDCCAWVFISQQYTPRDLLERIWIDVASTTDKSKLEAIKEEKLFASTNMEYMKEEQSLKSRLESMGEEDLVKELYEVLEQKRYLVVLDDIWNTEVWDCLKLAFPNGKKGSKILLTTRNKSLASADPLITRMEPPFLTDDEAWELLSRKAFPVEQSCPRDLENLGREMVKKCGGLPLAVVVLGGILATKKDLDEWRTVRENVNTEFTTLDRENQYGGVYGILAMSYHDLPYRLKPCFLYLSQFPEDWEFHKRTLIRMWIAEGFVAQSRDRATKTLEDVAEDCLDELVSRCMVQVTERNHTGIRVKIFRIHSLMRDICISKAEDEHFAGGIEHRDMFATNAKSCFLKSATSQPRRIAVHPRIDGDNAGKRFYVPLVKCGDPHLRSLHYFVDQRKYRMTRGQEIYILSHFRLLRILNLENI